MASQALSIPRSLGALFDVGVVGDVSDGQLLERFTTSHREAAELAFHSLVERHGPMVLRICRRLLDDPNDADDAFQATFLVLLRRAGAIRDRGSVAAWLYGVAVRVASRARVESARRKRIERQGVRPATGRNDDPDRLDLEALIDVELARLPEKYRAPIVLCYLEGLTHEVAAARLGWPVGTVRGRLARARDLLRSRLTRRGVTASAALAAVEGLCNSAKAAVPAALREATVRAVVEVASGSTVAAVTSARVAAWAAGTSRGLAFPRAITATSVLLLLGTVGTGLAMLGVSSPPPEAPQAQPAAPPESREAIRREMFQLKGTWTTTATFQNAINGVPQPPKEVKLVWSIDRDTITGTDKDGFAGMTYRFSVDPNQTPKTIDLNMLNTGLSLQGLYQLEGDTLIVSMGVQRPKDLDEGQGHVRMVFHRESRTPTLLPQEYPTAPGCYWALEPRGAVGSATYSSGIDVMAKKDPQGAMIITLAYVARRQNGRRDVEYRPVAFDDKKVRHLPKRIRGGGSESPSIRGVVLVMNEYRLDPDALPFDRVRNLGIELIPIEARQATETAASARAVKEARDAGTAILPWPEVGKPFAFSLTDTKGRVIRASELKGKVVLIDCWAGWCSPCMAKMPGLKQLYERRHGDGLEIVGINFDNDRARAEELVRTHGLPWTEVWVPDDDRTRRLWVDGPGIAGLPRLFLIDREGILRWDGGFPGGGDLEDKINSLLK
jgi:RNA polymerase sigma factor (sigma-70 family)